MTDTPYSLRNALAYMAIKTCIFTGLDEAKQASLDAGYCLDAPDLVPTGCAVRNRFGDPAFTVLRGGAV